MEIYCLQKLANGYFYLLGNEKEAICAV